MSIITTPNDLWNNVFAPLHQRYGNDAQVIVDYGFHHRNGPHASFEVGTNLITFTVEPGSTPEDVKQCHVKFTPNQKVTDQLVFDIENDTVSAFGVQNIQYKKSGGMDDLTFFCLWPGQYMIAVMEILDVIIPIIEMSRP